MIYINSVTVNIDSEGPSDSRDFLKITQLNETT